jgi:hypothetical protein
MNAIVKPQDSPIIRLDVGAGPHKKGPEWTGVDRIAFDGVDVVCDIGLERWPWDNDSVEEIHASHFLEHLTNFEGKWERTHFFNEAFRVMKPMGKMTLITPHWASNRFHGDPTHREMWSEMSFFYLDRLWRSQNAPHTDSKHNPNGYDCNWNCTWGYTMKPELGVRNLEYQQFAMANYKDSIMDMIATCVATKEPLK